MTGILTGNTSGATRADLVDKARKSAELYFGETCIEVQLFNQETECEYDVLGTAITEWFHAEFNARVAHAFQAAYVDLHHDRCSGCGKDYPQPAPSPWPPQ